MDQYPEAFAVATTGSSAQSKDTVTILNCTYANLSQPGAEEKHRDAARRAYSYFKDQSYTGPTVMVMVDSSDEPNPDMVQQAKEDPSFRYFHLPDRDNVPEEIRQEFPAAAAKIKPTEFFRTTDFKVTLANIQETIDENSKNPADMGPRPPLGGKRNFGVEIAKQMLAEQGLSSDVIINFDDDIYGSNYVQHAVDNLQDGNMFTAETGYMVAFPKADLNNPGEFEVQTGTYVDGQSFETYKWLETTGHQFTPTEDQTVCTEPYGFTYAVRTEAFDAVGGVADVLQGEDRSLFRPIRDKYGEGAINLRPNPSGNLVRLLGDNNSYNAVYDIRPLFVPELASKVTEIFDAWKTMLTNKYVTLLEPVQATVPEAQSARIAARAHH